VTPFLFVTGNPNKLEEARRVLGPAIEAVALELPEIQSLDLRAVLEAKADEAWRRVGRAVVVEDVSLETAAWAGLPGPFIKFQLERMGAEALARAAIAADREAGRPEAEWGATVVRSGLLLRDGECRVFAEGVVSGRLVAPPRGSHGFGFDPVFEPAGETRTFAELDPAEKDRVGHRGRAWRALARQLEGHQGH
jgi:non-canonical purine NTP pyrophosphatase (RdgB/HAM1 family)